MKNKKRLDRVSGGYKLGSKVPSSFDFGSTLFGDSFNDKEVEVTRDIDSNRKIGKTSCVNGKCSSKRKSTTKSYTTTSTYDGKTMDLDSLF